MLEAREQYFTMSCKFCLIVILKGGESVCKIFSHFSPSSDLDNCKDFAQLLSGGVIMNRRASWLISEYEFWVGKVLMMGGFYGQFDDGAMKCPPVSGVSGESQRGPELLRLRSLSRRHGERQSHKVPRQTPLDTELTRLFIALPGRGKSYGLTHSKH